MREGASGRHALKLAIALALSVLGGCIAPAQPLRPVVTDYGLGPDKWATAWLMARHAEPGAKLVVVPQGSPLPAGIAFDVPTSALRRERDHAAFQSVIEHYRLTDPALARMAQIVRDIEVNYWGQPDAAESPAVEHAFRELQIRHGRYSVAPECYLAFFDRIYAQLRMPQQTAPALDADDLRVDCHALASRDAQGPLVPEMPIPTLLAEMKAGKTVRFVDVREPEEFVEAHVPGALNIQLRALDERALAQVRGADYVVAYCIKDFRGFEMARSLRDAGVLNAVILNPYGIKGWIAEGLPTTGAKAMASAAAQTRLSECVMSPAVCKADAESAQSNKILQGVRK
jgi:rhodanese-related sulfurtransferase